LYLVSGYLTYNDDDKNSTSYKDILVGMIPSVGLVILDVIVKTLFDLCIKIEKWDFESTKLAQRMWRSYLAKLFTFSVVLYLLCQFAILEAKPEDVFGHSNFDFQIALSCPSTSAIYNEGITYDLLDYTNYNNCKEDYAANNLFVNLMTEFASNKITPFVILLVRYIYYKKIKKSEENYKPSFAVIDQATEVLVFNIKLYTLFPLFPFILLIAPILLFIQFKFTLFKLKRLTDKPKEMSLQDELAPFLMTVFSISMLGVIGILILYYVFPINRNNYLMCYKGMDDNLYYNYGSSSCGPYGDNITFKDSFVEVLQTNNA
jgi:hypothetical protein